MEKKLLAIVLLTVIFSGCSKVSPGHVGVKVYLLGGSKGVDMEELGVGRYWIGINEELFIFPTFQQNATWKDNPNTSEEEAFTFQSKEGMTIGASMGISYRVDPEMVSVLFQKYRKGIREITNVYVRNHIRNALNEESSSMAVTEIYGQGKNDLIAKVSKKVRDQLAPSGIIVDKIYYIGAFRLPTSVTDALNAKIKATQMAQQRENEIRQTQAEAQKRKEQAKGEAEAIMTIATAKAKANRVISNSLTKTLVDYNKVEKWNGILPKVNGGQNIISMDLHK